MLLFLGNVSLIEFALLFLITVLPFILGCWFVYEIIKWLRRH